MRPNSQYSPFIAALVMCFVVLLPAPAQVFADTVGWFDDEAAVDISRAPSIRISLGEQRAYFYMGGELVGVSRVSSGRAGYRTPKGSYRVRGKKLRHRSTLYGSYVDRNTHRVVRADVDTRKHRRPPALTTAAPRWITLSASMVVSDCTRPETYPTIPHRTAACACRGTWHRNSSAMLRWVRRSSSLIEVCAGSNRSVHSRASRRQRRAQRSTRSR